MGRAVRLYTSNCLLRHVDGAGSTNAAHLSMPNAVSNVNSLVSCPRTVTVPLRQR